MGAGLALGYTGMILMAATAGADLKSRSSEFFLKPGSMEGLLGNVVGLEPESVESGARGALAPMSTEWVWS